MQTYICAKCLTDKARSEFYQNIKKVNGLESHCKQCVLQRKAKKYEAITKTKRKTKQLRLHKNINVIDVEECTFHEVLINRPQNSEVRDPLNDLVSGVLCYQDMQKSKVLAMAG